MSGLEIIGYLALGIGLTLALIFWSGFCYALGYRASARSTLKFMEETEKKRAKT